MDWWKRLYTWQIFGNSKAFKYYLNTQLLPEYLNTTDKLFKYSKLLVILFSNNTVIYICNIKSLAQQNDRNKILYLKSISVLSLLPVMLIDFQHCQGFEQFVIIYCDILWVPKNLYWTAYRQEHWVVNKYCIWQKVVWLRNVCPTLDSSVLLSFKNSRCACDGGIELLMKLKKSLSFFSDVDALAALEIPVVHY